MVILKTGQLLKAWEPNFSGLGCGYWDNGDRRILVNSETTVYEYCFSSYDQVCPEPPVDVTLSLNTNEYFDEVETVEIQGSFIGYN